MSLNKRTLVVGLAGSVLVHATFAFAIVVLATGGVPGFSGTAGNIFMVSYDQESSLHPGAAGSPAFSARSMTPILKLKASEPGRLKNYIPIVPKNSSNAGAEDNGSLPSDGAPAGGGLAGSLKLVTAPKPPYPPAARRAGFEGRVLLEIEIAPGGEVSSVVTKEGSGREDCDESARSTIQNRWKFVPLQTAKPVRELIAVRFALR